MFYRVAMQVMLWIGVSWGISLLLQLQSTANFTRLNLYEINAHGQGQVYGWLALALLGACYQRVRSESGLILILMVFGILLNVLGLYWPSSSLLTLFGGSLLVGASFLFFLQNYSTLRSIEKKSPPFLQMGVLFFFLSAVYSLWHHQRIMSLNDEAAVIRQVATFQAPLRDLQVHGMALFLAIGLFSSKKSWKGWGFLVAGVIGEIALFLMYQMTANHLFAALLIVPWLFLLIGSLFSPIPFRLPYLWLILSLLMLIFLPLYSYFSHLPFSHAYYGAIRHAVTVGCFSQMVLLFMPKKQQNFPSLVLILLNLGCFARVFLQILSDFHPIGFALIPLSGGIELLSLLSAYFSLDFSKQRIDSPSTAK